MNNFSLYNSTAIATEKVMVAIDNASTPAPPPQVPIQVPPVPAPAPALVPAPAPVQAPPPPDFLLRYSSYILSGGIPYVFEALREFNNTNNLNSVVIGNVRRFKLKFVLHYDGVDVDVVVRQFHRADGQQIIVFQRASDGTVEFNTFLHRDLLELLRNNGIMCLDGRALPYRHYPRLEL